MSQRLLGIVSDTLERASRPHAVSLVMDEGTAAEPEHAVVTEPRTAERVLADV